MRGPDMGVPDAASARTSAAACAGYHLLHADILVLGQSAGATRRAMRVPWTLWLCPGLAGVARSPGGVEDVHTVPCRRTAQRRPPRSPLSCRDRRVFPCKTRRSHRCRREAAGPAADIVDTRGGGPERPV